MYTTTFLPSAVPAERVRGRFFQRIHAALTARLNGKYEERISSRKQQLFFGLRGDVLEIGPGAGANLAYLPVGIRWVGVEQNPFMLPYLKETATRLSLEIEVLEGTAERLPVEDASVDCVISTLVLCSVPQPAAVLAEIRRVLKPGGRFLFIEHVAAERGTGLRWLQTKAKPVSKMIGNGCCPDRETAAAIEQAGFSEVKMERFAITAGLSRPHITGAAVK